MAPITRRGTVANSDSGLGSEGQSSELAQQQDSREHSDSDSSSSGTTIQRDSTSLERSISDLIKGQEQSFKRFEITQLQVKRTQQQIDALQDMLQRLLASTNINQTAQNPCPPEPTAISSPEPQPNRPGSADTHFTDPIGVLSPNQSQTVWSQQAASYVAPTPIIINQIIPPDFHGDKSKAKSWLRDFEQTLISNGYPQVEWVTKARAYLKGNAAKWYQYVSMRHQDLDWPTFKEKFLADYWGANGRAQLERRLVECRQREDEHPTDFLVRIVDLCLQYQKNMPEREMIRRISDGLTDSLSNLLAASKDPELWTLDWLENRFRNFRTKEPVRPRGNKDGDHNRKSSSDLKKPKATPATWLCYNCEKRGHRMEECKEPRNEANVSKNKAAYAAEKSKERTGDSVKPAETRQINRVTRVKDNCSRKQAQRTSPRLAENRAQRHNLTISLNGQKVTGLVDCGADITVIGTSLAKKLGMFLIPWDQGNLTAFGNHPVKVEGTGAVSFTFKNVIRPLMVAVVQDNLIKQPLWGSDFLDAFGIKFDYSALDRVQSDKAHVGDNHVATVQAIVMDDKPIDIHPVDKIQFGKLANNELSVAKEMLGKFSDVFSRNEADIGKTKTVTHHIRLTDDNPVHSHAYKVPIRERSLMKETLDGMLKSGIIRESVSAFASPVFFVDKDGGKSKRLVADYRALNKKTILDRTPMPLPEDVFNMLSGTCLYAKFDITSMFNQVAVDDSDIHKTAIITPFGLFEYNQMPFGLANAPATAVRLMRRVLNGLDNNTCFVYFDDIIVFASNSDELLQRCTDVFSRLRQHGLKLKPAKCIYGVDQIRFLGQIVSANGIEMDKARIEPVLNFPTPQNPSLVRSFHGLCSYNRKFIKDFAEIAKPLTPLMGKPSEFKWTVEAQEAFDKLKNAVAHASTLVFFDPEATLELRTDASNVAFGAVLHQKSANPAQTGVVLYYSKTLDVHQRRYCATDRELLAAYLSIKHLRHYLIGKKFTLVTDHNPLVTLRTKKDPHHKFARWLSELQTFDFDIVYKPGVNHLDADCMSRLIPMDIDQDPDVHVDDEPISVNLLKLFTLSAQDGEDSPEQSDENLNEVAIDIESEQREDAFCSPIIKILESRDITGQDKLRKVPQYSLQDGKLYKEIQDGVFVLCVPERRRPTVLLSCHDMPLAGHMGFFRTYKLISSRYYWPKMRNMVKKYVASCPSCQKRKHINTRRQGLTKPLPIAAEVFDFVGIDLMTSLPRGNGGQIAILVCTDNLSKYAVTVALRDERAETIIHAFFNHFIAKFGCPRVILSDRGSNLIGERSRDFFRLFGIERVMTSARHPQTNGQTERFNRTLAASISMYLDRHQDNWPDYLQAATFAYNITEHSVTHISPFERVFKRKPRLPIDNLLHRDEFVHPSNPLPGSLSSEAIKAMREHVLKVQEANKRRLDANKDPCTFKEGDWVTLERPTRVSGQAAKFTNTRIGPYKIARRIDDLTFELMGAPPRQGMVHPMHLRHYIWRTAPAIDELVDPKFVPSERPGNQPEEGPDCDTDSADSDDDQVPLHELNPSVPLGSTDEPSEVIINPSEQDAPIVMNEESESLDESEPPSPEFEPLTPPAARK